MQIKEETNKQRLRKRIYVSTDRTHFICHLIICVTKLFYNQIESLC